MKTLFSISCDNKKDKPKIYEVKEVYNFHGFTFYLVKISSKEYQLMHEA